MVNSKKKERRMPYIKETCITGKVVEVRKYFSPRYHPRGEKRAPRKKPTPEQMAKVNQRAAERNLRRLMNANFRDGDFLVKLDFFNKQGITAEEMQKDIATFVKKLRIKFQGAGQEFKYIYVKEIGPRGSRHIHMMLPRCSTEILTAMWEHGGIHIDPLYSKGQYKQIAAYFIKYADKSTETAGKLVGKRWYASRNLVKPKVKKEVVKANAYRETPKVPKGYALEPDSVVKGTSEITGYDYYFYSCMRLEDDVG